MNAATGLTAAAAAQCTTDGCGRQARGDVDDTPAAPGHACRQCADHCALSAYLAARAHAAGDTAGRVLTTTHVRGAALAGPLALAAASSPLEVPTGVVILVATFGFVAGWVSRSVAVAVGDARRDLRAGRGDS